MTKEAGQVNVNLLSDWNISENK